MSNRLLTVDELPAACAEQARVWREQWRAWQKGSPMLAPFFEEHWNDTEGRPGGGVSSGTGMCLSWQHGPLGRGDSRREPNGCFVETVIAAARGRLLYYQESPFACEANAQAIAALEMALEVLDQRTQDREHRQVEGTHVA